MPQVNTGSTAKDKIILRKGPQMGIGKAIRREKNKEHR